MKEETRKLLNEIIKDYNSRQLIMKVMDEKEYNEAKSFNEKQDKIQEFLRSIPSIEEKLRLGGYIADKNNVPCCHGDKVKFQFDEVIGEGLLVFNANFKCFMIHNQDGDYPWFNSQLKWFEKIEEKIN